MSAESEELNGAAKSAISKQINDKNGATRSHKGTWRIMWKAIKVIGVVFFFILVAIVIYLCIRPITDKISPENTSELTKYCIPIITTAIIYVIIGLIIVRTCNPMPVIKKMVWD